MLSFQITYRVHKVKLFTTRTLVKAGQVKIFLIFENRLVKPIKIKKKKNISQSKRKHKFKIKILFFFFFVKIELEKKVT